MLRIELTPRRRAAYRFFAPVLRFPTACGKIVKRDVLRSATFVIRHSSFVIHPNPSKPVQTRLSRICDAIIEAGWLAALIVTPLFFNTFSNRVFEPDKLHLLRSIALVMAVAWLVQLLDSGFRRQPGGPGSLVAAADDAAGAAYPDPGRQLSAQHRAFGCPAHQLLRLLRADAGHVELPELRRHLRHGVDARAEPGPGQPYLLRGHHDQPAHRHLRHPAEDRARPAALGRRCGRACGGQHGQLDLRGRLPDHGRLPDAGTTAGQSRGDLQHGAGQHRRFAAGRRLLFHPGRANDRHRLHPKPRAVGRAAGRAIRIRHARPAAVGPLGAGPRRRSPRRWIGSRATFEPRGWG